MDILLKVTDKCFSEINNGKNSIKHGYSKNKKYKRLFQKIEKIELKNEITGETILKEFKNIKILEKDNKKYFEIEFL